MKHFIICLVFLLIACSEVIDPPEKILEDYLNATINQEFGRVYDLLSEKDKKIFTREQFLAIYQPKDEISNMIAKKITERVEYEIIEINTHKHKSEIIVYQTTPDANATQLTLKQIMTSVLLDTTQTELTSTEYIIAKFDTLLNDGTIPIQKHNETYDLLKEKDGWRVWLQWEER